MRRTRAVHLAAWATAAALVVGACSDDPDVQGEITESPPAWGQEAEDWAFAMQALVTAQGGVGVLPFIAEGSTLDARTLQHSAQYRRGVDEIVQWYVQSFPMAAGYRGVELWSVDPPVFLDPTGMVILGTYRADPLTASEPVQAAEVMLLVDVAPEGVVHQHLLSAAGSWRGASAVRPLSVVDDAVAAAETWAADWSRTDPAAPMALYGNDVEFDDAVAGISTRGSTAIVDRREVSPPVVWTIESRSDGPATYHFSPEWSRRIDQLAGVAFVVSGDDGDACPGRQTVWLELDSDGLITRERRYWAVDDARRCQDALPDGWWAGRPVPGPAVAAPYEDLATVTESITVGDAPVSIRNGTATLATLVAWAGSRFERAGMTPPKFDSVTFTKFTDYCDEVRGRSIPRSAPGTDRVVGWDIVLCVDEDDVCRRPECSSYQAGASFAALHELAHVWMDQHLAEEVRDAFRERVGLEVWDDPEAPWDERAIEWAASIIAWGLLDSGYYLMELGNPPPELRLAGFQLLTARQPLQPDGG